MSNLKCSELDSFYESRFLVYVDNSRRSLILSLAHENGFSSVLFAESKEELLSIINCKKCDIFIIEEINNDLVDIISQFRSTNSDAALICISKNGLSLTDQLTLKIDVLLGESFCDEDLIKAVKQSLGSKVSHEIGMQFFDALFGMQMCTHRDLHKRTFDHVIRTTKIYGKFLLHLMDKGIIDLTSWTLKNCLMASLVHDIGKLLVLHGILYKEGKLTEIEYQQVKRHPWNSVTALLGGQDIQFFAQDGALHSVSGYNDKNLAEKTKKWIFDILGGNRDVYDDIENYFEDLSVKPFVHSLNKDLLYIVFRHHDSVDKSYHSDEDLNLFAKIIDRNISPNLDENSYLDIVTNALSLCDIYDALIDKSRDYRSSSYTKTFTLYLLYIEMKQNKFFPLLTEEFIKFIVENELHNEKTHFFPEKDGQAAFNIIKKINDSFCFIPGQELEFNRFMSDYSEKFSLYAKSLDEKHLISLNNCWIEFFTVNHKQNVESFLEKLTAAKLISKKIGDFSIEEIKIFDLLYNFYYSYSSVTKRRKIIEYFTDTVINKRISEKTKKRLITILESEEIHSLRELQQAFVQHGFERNDLFETFKQYDEELLLTEFNQGFWVNSLIY